MLNVKMYLYTAL